jgi:hypothetical protein
MSEDPMKQEQPYERMLQTLQEDEARRLSKCLEEIDHSLLDCRKYVEEYDQVRSTLHTINEQLSRLGAEPLPVVDGLPTHDLGEVIKNRIDHMRSQGKI